jgi:biotin synthase-like enzyme
MMESFHQLVKFKAEILCYGIKVRKEFEENLYSQGLRRTKRFGMARGVKIILGNKLVVSATFGDRYTKKSPLELFKIKDEWFIERRGEEIFKVALLESPDWYFKKMVDNTLVMEHVQLHSLRTLAASLYGGCDFSRNDACKFCKRNVAQNAGRENLDILSEAVACATGFCHNCSLSLNTGFVDSADRGAEMFACAMQKIRRYSDIPIGVEMCPPQTINQIEKMIEAGMGSLTINMEFVNEEYRKSFCPGKSRIPQKDYFDAARYTISQLGEGSVSSVLIAGLTTKQEVIKGAEVLVKNGIVPSICAFRPFDGTALQEYPVTPSSDLIDITREVVKLMRAQGIRTERDEGCIKCGACSLENDFCQSSEGLY